MILWVCNHFGVQTLQRLLHLLIYITKMVTMMQFHHLQVSWGLKNIATHVCKLSNLNIHVIINNLGNHIIEI